MKFEAGVKNPHAHTMFSDHMQRQPPGIESRLVALGAFQSSNRHADILVGLLARILLYSDAPQPLDFPQGVSDESVGDLFAIAERGPHLPAPDQNVRLVGWMVNPLFRLHAPDDRTGMQIGKRIGTILDAFCDCVAHDEVAFLVGGRGGARENAVLQGQHFLDQHIQYIVRVHGLFHVI